MAITVTWGKDEVEKQDTFLEFRVAAVELSTIHRVVQNSVLYTGLYRTQ
jgi:hypothetical protein